MKHHFPTRRLLTVIAAATSAIGLAGATALTAGASAAATRAPSEPFTFKLVPSAGIAACLPHAGGKVTITPGKQNDVMSVSVHGMPHGAEFDLFVIQKPEKPFGVSWYQTDIKTGRLGNGNAVVAGIFDKETFTVSPDPAATIAPTHQFHLGLWFNNPRLAFNLGCEPGAPNPVVTPFNGEQHAGIQVLNTAQFPVNAGPLSHVHR
ncbi:MAG: hypothetical protein LBV34_05255 [Nocardiopsaceae bacterium]|jgi:hypothetical protein|nr:hypothetical protein [Nocardiopsaceae bacterium]